MVKSPSKSVRLMDGARDLGTQYTMNRGEGISKHSHTPTDVHITVCQIGPIRIRGPAFDGEVGQIFVPPDIINFATNSPHEIEAEADGVVIANLLKYPQNG